MTGASKPATISTKVDRIAKLAKAMPRVTLNTLAHHIDMDWMHEAYRRTRKDGATGVDGQTAAEYAANLDENLETLLTRAKQGYSYRAPPVRRVHIPKGDGRTRPIGVPTFEDKVLQRAVLMVLEPVYEQDFLDCSYGFRPGRSAHRALDALWKGLMSMGGGFVLEGDIESFFDSVDTKKLQEILRKRVRDGVLTRLIGKWLNAGVMEEGRVYRPESGTPQGGVISPLLANIYLHEVLDEWFESEVRPRLKGRAFLIRFADDFVAAFERQDDARRVHAVLAKRFAKYGLRLHPEKTRLVEFRPPSGPKDPTERRSFDLLGFTHFWGRSRKGNWVVKRKTAKSRFSRALRNVNTWLRSHRHLPVVEQQRELNQKLRGHYGYYGITGNSVALVRFRDEVSGRWRKWLSRRSWAAQVAWTRFDELKRRFPLLPARAVHSVLARAAKP